MSHSHEEKTRDCQGTCHLFILFFQEFVAIAYGSDLRFQRPFERRDHTQRSMAAGREVRRRAVLESASVDELDWENKKLIFKWAQIKRPVYNFISGAALVAWW